jgi:hypothetical protein
VALVGDFVTFVGEGAAAAADEGGEDGASDGSVAGAEDEAGVAGAAEDGAGVAAAAEGELDALDASAAE